MGFWIAPEAKHRPTRIFAGEAVLLPRVADGTRTRDSQDHNLVLYQLNYTHHRIRWQPLGRLRLRYRY